MIPTWSTETFAGDIPTPFLLAQPYVGTYARGEVDIALETEGSEITNVIDGEYQGVVVAGVTAEGDFGFQVNLERIGIYGALLVDYFLILPGILLAQESCGERIGTVESCPSDSLITVEGCEDATYSNESSTTITIVEESC